MKVCCSFSSTYRILIKTGIGLTKDDEQEDSPLLENSVSSDHSLSFWDFLHPIMLGVIFCVFVISSILSAFEAVSRISYDIENGSANQDVDPATVCT